MTRKAAVVLLALVTAACTGSPAVDAPASTTLDATTTTAPPVASSAVPSTTGDDDEFDGDLCGQPDVVFTEEGLVGAGGVEESDAAIIRSLGWEAVGECQRLRMTFATLEGAPAVSPPEVEVQLLRYAGVIRVTFGPTVTDTVIGEQVVETGWIDRIYAVTQVDGTLMLDIVLREPVFARVLAESAPAAVIIDVTPGGDAYPTSPVRAGDVVIIGPDPEVSRYPVTITGYTLGGDDRISGVLNAPDGSTVIGQATVGTSPHTWGGFSMVFPDGPAGDVTITVDDGPTLSLTLG